ncbi:DUF7504 family protein [Salinigranum sp. GCM10025319]|uniref:DUF7504 family protein n=1 Tax=Salinigranum sp. GCM10025319 TaxID=3252687 RepID=UPI00362293E9
MGTGGDSGPTDEETESFVDALAALKRRGSALLVVGAVPEEAYHTASRAMLGDANATPPRRRLLVTPSARGHDVVPRLRRTGPVSPETAHVVACSDGARSVARPSTNGSPATAGTAPPPTAGIDARTTHVDGGLGELGEAISRAIDGFVRGSGGLDPAELRIAFDCLPSLADRLDEETLFRFVHLLTAHVRSVTGMIHVWLPQPRDARLVRLLEPLFDAIVELRVNGVLTQRWEFRDSDVTSDWIELNFD